MKIVHFGRHQYPINELPVHIPFLDWSHYTNSTLLKKEQKVKYACDFTDPAKYPWVLKQ